MAINKTLLLITCLVFSPFLSTQGNFSIAGLYQGTETYQEELEKPVFSRSGGFYKNDFELDITHPDPEAIIYYTMDGSEPDAESGIWNGPVLITDRSGLENGISMIPTTNVPPERPEGWLEPAGLIRKGTVIRAKAVKSGYVSSSIVTQSYFVFPEGDEFHQLPVFSLVTHPDNLFDYETGIYIPGIDGESGNMADGNFQNRGIESERQGSLEFYEEDGSLAMVNDIGYRIHGGWSRRNAQKTLRLYARSDYGENRFYHRFLHDLPYDNYNRLLLRNSGNDWGYTMFRDALAQNLVSHLNFETQAYRPSVLYINGEYWGIHNIRERYDKHYLERVYGVDPDSIDLLTGRHHPKEGNNQHYLGMIDYAVNNDLGQSNHYEHMQTLLDVDNYLNYFSVNIYFANNDWPHNNIDFWRYQVPFDSTAGPGFDGRWRWLLFDVDRSFNFSTRSHTNMIEWVTARENERLEEEWPNLLFLNLLENSAFKTQFLNLISDHLNTTFEPEHVKAVIGKMKEQVESEIDEHIVRWQKPSSYDEWLHRDGGVVAMLDFADDRPEYLRTHVREHFDLEDVSLTLNINDESGGYITINNIDINGLTPGVPAHPYPWTGEYFQNVPVQLSAVSWPGYRFSHWEIYGEVSTGKSLNVPMSLDTEATAYFVEEENTGSYPEPHIVNNGDYHFTFWDADEDAGSYPDHMAFVYMNEDEPSLSAEIEGYTSGAYNLDSRSRINGLGNGGFSFINTSNLEGNPGYPGRRLGGAILALDSRGHNKLNLSWTGGTVQPNSRIYNIRLQYRLGDEGPFNDMTDDFGKPIEYPRNTQAGHSLKFDPIELPAVLGNKPYVQLRWLYYYTGRRDEDDTGQRSKLNISEIVVKSGPLEDDGNDNLPSDYILNQNYPNPFNSFTVITYAVPEPAEVTLEVFNIQGQQVALLESGWKSAGEHSVHFDASRLASGIYIYRLSTADVVKSRKMLFLK